MAREGGRTPEVIVPHLIRKEERGIGMVVTTLGGIMAEVKEKRGREERGKAKVKMEREVKVNGRDGGT
jgi:hypothetical protein